MCIFQQNGKELDTKPNSAFVDWLYPNKKEHREGWDWTGLDRAKRLCVRAHVCVMISSQRSIPRERASIKKKGQKEERGLGELLEFNTLLA